MNLNPILIKKILKAGHQILCIPDTNEFWIVNSFIPPRCSGQEPTEFSVVNGYELTEYFEKYQNTVNDANFVEKLENYIADSPTLTAKYSANTNWKLYILD